MAPCDRVEDSSNGGSGGKLTKTDESKSSLLSTDSGISVSNDGNNQGNKAGLCECLMYICCMLIYHNFVALICFLFDLPDGPSGFDQRIGVGGNDLSMPSSTAKEHMIISPEKCKKTTSASLRVCALLRDLSSSWLFTTCSLRSLPTFLQPSFCPSSSPVTPALPFSPRLLSPISPSSPSHSSPSDTTLMVDDALLIALCWFITMY